MNFLLGKYDLVGSELANASNYSIRPTAARLQARQPAGAGPSPRSSNPCVAVPKLALAHSARDVAIVRIGEANYEEVLLRDYVMGVGYE